MLCLVYDTGEDLPISKTTPPSPDIEKKGLSNVNPFCSNSVMIFQRYRQTGKSESIFIGN